MKNYDQTPSWMAGSASENDYSLYFAISSATFCHADESRHPESEGGFLDSGLRRNDATRGLVRLSWFVVTPPLGWVMIVRRNDDCSSG